MSERHSTSVTNKQISFTHSNGNFADNEFALHKARHIDCH